MPGKPFTHPIPVELDSQRFQLACVEHARDALMDTRWPVRGPSHQEALDACHKVLAGERSILEAEKAVRLAVEEASGGSA